MGKTQISGKRLRNNIITLFHLSKDIKIPEEYLQLNYSTHLHENKSTLDVLTNSNPSLVKLLDLKDVYLTINDVISARDAGLTLKATLDKKAQKNIVDEIVKELEIFKGDKASMKEVLDQLFIDVSEELANHKGKTTHKELDKIYQEIIQARGIYTNLDERLNNISLGPGVDGSNSKVWTVKTIIPKGTVNITTPNPYKIGESSLMVYEESLLLSPGDTGDYLEIDNNTIQLLFPIEEDTVFTFMGIDNGTLHEWTYRTETEEGQQSINTLFEYTPNLNQLMVYEDGILLNKDIDYREIDNYNISLAQPLPVGCLMTVIKKRG